jgi:hypothetical protein
MRYAFTYIKLISMCIFFILLITISSDAQSPDNIFHWGDPIPPRLFLDRDDSSDDNYYLAYGELSSRLSGDIIYFTKNSHCYYGYDGGRIILNPNETITLTIEDVGNRPYNPNIEIELCINPGALNPERMRLDAQMRCDGNSDGHFEYIIDFTSIPFSDSWAHVSGPSSTNGQALDMDGGTIELILSSSESNPEPLTIQCNSYSYLQIPFDLDTDNDGTTDYSDTDDDNDGYTDGSDRFPLDPSEWRDSDLDLVGDNEDDDDNDNKIPDILEIPISMGIILVPFVIILIVMNKMKKKREKEEDSDLNEEEQHLETGNLTKNNGQ